MTPVTDRKMELRKMEFVNQFFCLSILLFPFFCRSTSAEPLLAHWCARIGVQHQFLGLRRMTTRWGTCVPSKGRIWLNVALFPRHPALLEYVIVHEAVHLAEGSHGPRFRALMDLHLPDWRARRTQLDATT